MYCKSRTNSSRSSDTDVINKLKVCERGAGRERCGTVSTNGASGTVDAETRTADDRQEHGSVDGRERREGDRELCRRRCVTEGEQV